MGFIATRTAKVAPRSSVGLSRHVERYPSCAPMTFALYTSCVRYCHVAAMRWDKLTSNGVIAIEET